MNKLFELSGGDDHHKAVKTPVLDHPNFSMHIKTCTVGSSCSYPRCSSTQAFIKHYRNCNIVDCRVCFRVRNMQQKRKEFMTDISYVNEIYDTRDVSGTRSVVSWKDFNPVQKRLKIDHVFQSLPSGYESCSQSYAYSDPRALQQGCTKLSDVTCTEMENRAILAKGSLSSDNTLTGMSNDGSSMLITTEKGIEDPSIMDVDAQNEEATQQKDARLRNLLDLLVHALQCQNCQNSSCKMKSLIQHGANCKTRETGCCVQCKKIAYLFKHHAESCKLSQCHIPHCRGFKEQIRRNKEQAELRGHAA